jgi:hypothetical protein
MPRISVNASRYGTPGEIIAVERGQVVWAGLIKDIDEAGCFDALFCHNDDEEWLIRVMLSDSAGAALSPRMNPIG